MFISMDIQGNAIVRSLKDLEHAETILFTINCIPKEVDDYAKILMNAEKPDSEGELILLINDEILLLDIQGR